MPLPNEQNHRNSHSWLSASDISTTLWWLTGHQYFCRRRCQTSRTRFQPAIHCGLGMVLWLPHRPKQMHRLKHSWVNPKITELWVALDSYEHAVLKELLVKVWNRRGNASLPRSDGPRLESDVPAPKFLPKNLYADDWWVQLNEGAQLAIGAENHIDIPTLPMHQANPTNHTL